jgi:hypothetical protein
MKIETHLSPNCSEATFVIVNWKKKQILDTFEMTSECGDCEEAWFIKSIDEYARKKDVSITEGKNNGDSYHPEIIEAIEANVKAGRQLNMDEDTINRLLAENTNTSDDIKTMITKLYMTNAEALAAGLYGGKSAKGK